MPQEEGRIRYKPSVGSFVYDYFIKDYLGNVRTVLTDEQDQQVYQAGIEEDKRSFEVSLFGEKINTTATPKPGGFDVDNANQRVSRVDGTTAEGRVGPGVILKVMAGDKFNAKVNAWYQPSGMDNSTDPNFGNVINNNTSVTF